METVPAIFKILAVFGGMLALIRWKVPLGLAILAGGVGLYAWSGHPPAAVLAAFGRALAQPFLWLLLATTALIVEFGRHMARPEHTAAMLALSQHWGGRRGRLWSLMALPALVGLVPMPAGALFSAPMVQQALDEPLWNRHWKAAVNYWFRHVWEYWWPLYPAVIIGMAVFAMETWQFVAALVAFTPATFAVGYALLLHPHRAALTAPPVLPTRSLRGVLAVVLPLGIIIACVVLLPPLLARLLPALDSQLRKLAAMLAGMLLGLGLIALQERGQPTGLFRAIVAPHSLNVLLIVGGVAVFQSLLEDSGLVPQASRDLLQSGIPVRPVIALLPFLAGLITGNAAGFAGIAFPLVVGLLLAPGSGLTPMATLALAFGSGYIGMMLSPIHLCLLVSRDFFGASLLPLFRHVVPCIAAMAVFTLLVFALYQALGW